MDMQHGHGHAVWTRTCSMDMYTQHGFSHTAWMPECPKRVQSGIISFPLVYNAWSGIGILASWSVRYRWSRTSPLVPSYAENKGKDVHEE
jgi:hypothetical protein